MHKSSRDKHYGNCTEEEHSVQRFPPVDETFRVYDCAGDCESGASRYCIFYFELIELLCFNHIIICFVINSIYEKFIRKFDDSKVGFLI